MISLGTSDTFFTAIKSPTTDPEGCGHVFGNPACGFMSLICFTNGSLAREKVKEECEISWNDFDNKSFEVTEPGNNGNMILPYFVSENTPLVPAAGIKLTGNEDFCNGSALLAVKVRAIVESQALTMKHHSEWISNKNPFSTIRITGGGSKSNGICQVVADVFQAEVERISITDSAVLGAAMRTSNADENRSWSELNKKFTMPTETITPNKDNCEEYQKAVAKFAEFEKES